MFKIFVITGISSLQVRMFMKTWAFVRSNLNRAIKFKKDDDEPQAENLCPDFSYYLYFLFAPTLVYKDEYPRYISMYVFVHT